MSRAAMNRSKYAAVKTDVDGITFHSKKEARRYAELRLLERAGEISGLVLQPPFVIEVAGVIIATYRADFAYMDRQCQRIVEDVKGFKTPVYRLKKKLVEALHGIQIREL